jgi:hypothetical protein
MNHMLTAEYDKVDQRGTEPSIGYLLLLSSRGFIRVGYHPVLIRSPLGLEPRWGWLPHMYQQYVYKLATYRSN